MDDRRAQPSEAQLARQLWLRLEQLAAVSYFDEGCIEALKALGLRGFWMGYFASRAAPLGPVGPGVVEALFFNFAPHMPRRALPDAWRYADPDAVLDTRRSAAAGALSRIVPDLARVAEQAVPMLESCTASAPGFGRPLFCANRDVIPSDDPVENLWQLATTLREHRGDAHVSVLDAHGLSGCTPHVLLAADRGLPPEMFQKSRGWSAEDWARAADDLSRRGLLSPAGTVTSEGTQLRQRMEDTTDELAAEAYAGIGADGMQRLIQTLDGAAHGVSASRVIPSLNPIGLPSLS